MKFVIYEIWTRASVVEAESFDEALSDAKPTTDIDNLTLSNWHVIPVLETEDK